MVKKSRQSDLFNVRNEQIVMEIEERDRILAALGDTRSGWLDEIRAEMARLYERRRTAWGAEAFVTADDARAYFESLSPPPPEALSRNFLGAVFKKKGWRAVGFSHSQTKGSHGNLIRKWQLTRTGENDA